MQFKLLLSAMLCAAVLEAMLSPRTSFGVDNPVSYDAQVNDCDCLRWAGQYYITGNWMAGDMMVSSDLTNWGPRVHVFSAANAWGTGGDSEIHASDPNYLNGKFHLYFQMQTGIGHAMASRPLGPYVETSLDTPFSSSNIDPELFVDDDGTPYFYRVRFNDGNVIWGQALSAPDVFDGSPVQLLSANAATWETLDSKVNEGPQVFKYRNSYYMLYNANHTSSDYGNYAIGCATANTPLGFGNENKYPHPVLDSATQVGGPGRISNCGQPWVVRGPNGFEWWIGYFAVYSSLGYGSRYQAIDRLHFFDQQLYVDGPTNLFTEGYHPKPRQPQYSGLFEASEDSAKDWEADSGLWLVHEGALHQTQTSGYHFALLKQSTAEHYLLEATVTFNTSSDQKAGLRVYQSDADNWLFVGLDQGNGAWYWHLSQAGAETVKGTPLPADFDFTSSHNLRVEKNGASFYVWLDGKTAPGAIQPIDTSFNQPGRAGLYTDYGHAFFDGIIYTVGWDERAENIGGWDSAGGNWENSLQGLVQSATSGQASTFKGDLSGEYEFSVQITPAPTTPDGQTHRVGIYPIMIDDSNYVSAQLDLNSNLLSVGGMQDGQTLESISVPLPAHELLPTSQQQGQNWRYTTTNPGQNWNQTAFDDSAWTEGEGGFGAGNPPNTTIRTTWNTEEIWLRKSFTLDQAAGPFTQLYLYHDENAEVYINGQLAASLPERPQPYQNPYTTYYKLVDITGNARRSLTAGVNHIAIHCKQTEGGQYIDAGLYNPKLPKDASSGINLRTIKLHDKLYLFVNGQETLSISHRFGPSKVGLCTNNTQATFNGIMFFSFHSPHVVPPWENSDVGAVSGAGAADQQNGIFTIESAGSDIWNTSDQCHYIFRPIKYDGWLSARLTSLENTSNKAKAVLMFRETLQSASSHFSLCYSPDGVLTNLRRETTSASTSAYDATGGPFDLPLWLKVERQGNLFSCSYSKNGTDWQTFFSRTVPLKQEIMVGMAATSNNLLTQSTSCFDNVTFYENVPQTAAKFLYY